MPIKHLTFFAAALCLLVSCKKNSGGSSSANPNKLKLYIEDDQVAGSHQTDTFTVTYDDDNRITSLASPILKFVYTYSSKSYTFDTYENSLLAIHEIGYIGGNTLVDSTFQFNNTNDTTTEGYVYNGKQLTRMLTYSYSNGRASIDTRDDYTYDNNGNGIKDVQSDGQGNINIVYAFTYTDKPMSATINPTYLPMASQYLPATQTLTDGSGTLLGTITYTYVFDSSGRLTKETDAADNGDVAVKTYVY